TPLPGCFSPFPHGTGSLSVTRKYLALGDGPPGFRRNFTCSAVLRIHSGGDTLSATGLLPCVADRSRSLRLICPFVTPYRVSYNPKRQASWFGLFPFRSPLLRESHLLSLPPGTWMFQFPGSAFSCAMYSHMDSAPFSAGGSPIRKSPDHRSLTAARSISVLVPSFFGS